MALAGIGSDLKGHSGDKTVDSVTKDNDYIGFYFSAHWCPPCRSFTPVLSKFYTELKETGKSLEIVFVTCDRSEDQFTSYFKEMPWLAVPFEESDARQKLMEEYGVSGIPYFVLVNAKTGDIITKEGREKVSSSPKDFPWV